MRKKEIQSWDGTRPLLTPETARTRLPSLSTILHSPTITHRWHLFSPESPWIAISDTHPTMILLVLGAIIAAPVLLIIIYGFNIPQRFKLRKLPGPKPSWLFGEPLFYVLVDSECRSWNLAIESGILLDAILQIICREHAGISKQGPRAKPHCFSGMEEAVWPHLQVLPWSCGLRRGLW